MTFIPKPVSTHSRLKAAGVPLSRRAIALLVSTHSRLKAAGCAHVCFRRGQSRFNTQPPEGGWDNLQFVKALPAGFQHTAA